MEVYEKIDLLRTLLAPEMSTRNVVSAYYDALE